jgi:hypothetical protein
MSFTRHGYGGFENDVNLRLILDHSNGDSTC